MKGKRALSIISLTLMLCLIFTGCQKASTDKGSTSSQSQTESTGKQKQVTIRFSPLWGVDKESNIARERFNQFVKENPQYRIELEEIQGDEQKNKIRVDVAANNEPDVWQFWPGCVCKEYAAAGILANVDEYMAKSKYISVDNFSDTVWAPCTFDGKRLCLPRIGASAVLLANKSLFQKYNLKYPETWEEFMEVGRVFRENGVTPLNVGSKLGNPSHFWYNELVCQYTSGVQDVLNLLSDDKMKFDTEAMRKAAKLVEEMRNAGMFAEDTLGQTGDWAPSTAYYNEGKSAMCYTLSWEFDSFSEETLNNSEIIKFPQLPDTDREWNHIQGTTNDCYCISARGWNQVEKQEAITALMDLLLTDITRDLAQAGCIITVDQKISKEIDFDKIETRLMSDVLKWREANNIQADPMIWQSLPTLAVQTVYCNALDELWAGSISADEFIEKCQASMDEYLASKK